MSFETSISIKQDLTFDYARVLFRKEGIDISDEIVQRNLKLRTNNDMYTTLALIVSDQNPFITRIACYKDYGKDHFLDKKELTGSIFKIYDEALSYLKLMTPIFGLVEETRREDRSAFPEICLGECLLNSFIHRD